MNSVCRIALVFIIFISASSRSYSQIGKIRERLLNRSASQGPVPTAPVYKDLDNWASHPTKHDAGDSIPEPLRKEYSYDSTIDVFFIHPTTYLQKVDGQMNADLDNKSLNDRTDTRTIMNQASAFNEFRLFAPRYRQANFSAYMGRNDKFEAVFDTAYADIKKAFQYYLEHWNNGHPFFIASHSQGSQHAVRLISELIEGTELEKRLVAAYIIGMPPVKSPKLKIPVCNDSSKTGCYVAWNTFNEDYKPRFESGKIELKTVNPLTWTTSDIKASSDLHKGAVVKDFNVVKPHALSAQIKSGRLIITSESGSGEIPGRLENLHILDISLFYVDIRENLKTRAANYKKKNAFTAY